MGKRLKYSVLRYSPSVVAGESINLGVLVCTLDKEFRKFFYTAKWNRVKEFDDELDIDVLKVILKSIEDEVSKTMFNINDDFDIKYFTSYYMNEYHFDAPIDLCYDELDTAVDEICKMYLRFDYDKKRRPSREQEIAFISKLLKNKNVQYRRNEGIAGRFNDKIVYDYVLPGYGIKIFHLKSSSINKIMNDIKAWAWNCEKNKLIKTMIFYEYDTHGSLENRAILQSAIRILKDATEEVYILQDGIAQLNKLLESKTIK